MADSFTLVGFSTSEPDAYSKHQWKLYGSDVIKRDLLNHFNTRVGQRIGRPRFGCRIWDYLMEQRTDATIRAIEEEIKNVCQFDKRVEFLGVDMVESGRGIIARVSLRDNLSKDTWDFAVDFDERQGVATRG
jgi:phage baseplate assembly protein W